MADEKLNTGPAENTSPEAAGPITTPEQAAASEPRQEQTGPARRWVRGDISQKRLSEQHQHCKWARPSQGHDPALNRLAACSSGLVALLALRAPHRK